MESSNVYNMRCRYLTNTTLLHTSSLHAQTLLCQNPCARQNDMKATIDWLNSVCLKIVTAKAVYMYIASGERIGSVS